MESDDVLVNWLSKRDEEKALIALANVCAVNISTMSSCKLAMVKPSAQKILKYLQTIASQL
jgi:hypothetical protein